MSYTSSFYKIIDMQAAAKALYGEPATAYSTGEHADDWRVRLARKTWQLDVDEAVKALFGDDHMAVLVGVKNDDWRAVQFEAIQDKYVLPVLHISTDCWRDTSGVATGLYWFRSVLSYCHGWYNTRLGKSFRPLQPLVIPSTCSNAQWVAICESTHTSTDDDDRWNLLYTLRDEYQAAFPSSDNQLLKIVFAPFIGERPDVFLGAAAVGSRYAGLPPMVCSVDMPDWNASTRLSEKEASVAWSVAHEMGHTWGLPHPGEDIPEELASQSIMSTAKPPEAILLDSEQEKLNDSGFFYTVERQSSTPIYVLDKTGQLDTFDEELSI